jgi:hypothetical protein
VPWLIQHKCNITQSGFSEYAIFKVHREGQDLTRVTCPNVDCREEFVILGHEMFTEAVPAKRVLVPPGIIVPTSRRSG